MCVELCSFVLAKTLSIDRQKFFRPFFVGCLSTLCTAIAVTYSSIHLVVNWPKNVGALWLQV